MATKSPVCLILIVLLAFILSGAKSPPDGVPEPSRRNLMLEEIERVSMDSLGTRWFADWIYEKGKEEEGVGELDNAWACYELYLSALKYNATYEFSFLSEYEREESWRQVSPKLKDIQRFAVAASEWYPPIGSFAYDCELFSKSLLLISGARIQQNILDSGDAELIRAWEAVADAREQQESIGFNLRQAEREMETKRMSVLSADSALLRQTEVIENAKVRYTGATKMAREAEENLVATISGRQDRLFPESFEVGWEDVRKSLGNNSALIEYFVCPDKNGDDKYYAFVLTRQMEYPLIVPLGSEKAIEVCLRDKIHYQGLYEALWLPLERYFDSINEVFVIPAGIIHTAPFAGVFSDKGYLYDRYKVHHLLSGKNILNRKATNGRFECKTALLAGGVDYDFTLTGTAGEVSETGKENEETLHDALRSTRGQGFSYLPGSLAEIDSISTLLTPKGWSVRTLSDISATEPQFRSDVSSLPAELLHISTHGFYIPEPVGECDANHNLFRISDNPLMRSGLAFSGANIYWNKQQSDPAVANDGILTALEISRLNLSGVKLVVLPACGSGLGLVDNSEGVYGLQRAFRIAGAGSMIVSLWDIPDEQTSEIMTLFYRYLAGGHAIKSAFDMSLKLTRHRYPGRPDFWAGFALIE